MDDKINIIENFETILKERRKNTIPSLYNNVKVSTKHTNRPQDVIKLVSSQLKAIQMADRVYDKDLQRHNKTKIIVDKSAANKAIPRKNAVNKFETQGVSDTQLIDVVKMAEAFDNCGTTQDLDISITASDLEKMYKVNDGPARDPEGNSIENEDAEVFPKGVDSVLTDNGAIETTFVGFTEDFDIETDKALSNQNNKIINECIGVDNFDELERDGSVSLSPILNRKEQSNAVKNSVLKERDKERSVSPVFDVKGVKKSKSPQPLVFSLESFEKFEQIAIPLMEENEDLETAKHLINSQILDKELFLPSKCNNEVLINCQFSGKENEGAGSNIGPNNDKGEDTEADKIDKDIKPRLFDDKTSSILEDEILFSSDEENYEHKEIQDLPFTCALETSFYEQSDILDKTVYVGFQTASNKSIQVNTESFNKAKSLLSEIEPSVRKELTLTELVHICDMPKNDEFNKQRAISPEILNEGEDSVEIPDISISTLSKLAGTAIKEIDLNDPGPGKKHHTHFPDISMLNSAICNLSQEEDKDKHIKEETRHSLELISKVGNPDKGVFEGFKTASKKIIKLSDAALARCQKVFQDIDLDTKYDETDKNIIPDTKITVISEQDKDDNKIENSNDDDIQADINDESILQEFENIEMSIGNDNSVKHDEPAFVGFKTANHKNIKVSTEAAEKAKRLFSEVKKDYPSSEISEPNYSDSIRNNNNFKETINIGFKTASNKNINISEQALAKTKTFFQDIELDDVETEKSNSKGNKPLTNAKEITRKVGDDKLIFEDFNQPSTSKDFLGTNNVYNNINISDNNPVYETGVLKPEFGGFKTASNKKVKISEEALVRSKKLFSDISDTNLGCNLDDLKDNKHIPHLVGFQTANKKPINISADALERSKKIFQEEIPETKLDIPENVKPIPNVVRFQTANNKPVHISAKALERSRKVFQEEIPESNQDIPGNVKSIPTVVGFKTANQKPVSISYEALAKSKKILEDFDAIQFQHKDEMVGDDLVSKQETNQIPSNLYFYNANACVDKSTGFKGFRTASKKDVEISKEALEKCKNMFQDNDFTNNFNDNDFTTPKIDNNDNKETMCGFKTASNKVVSISAASLARSKRLFEDIDDENTTNNLQVDKNKPAEKAKVCYSVYKKSDSRKPTTNENVDITKVTNFGGFKTANNKHVKVSEQALAITKDIFKDIENVTKDNEIKVTKDQESLHIIKNAAKRYKTSKDLKETITKKNIEDIIDTQVLNNFETTLHTEDFHQEVTKTNKRSGSPILSCPRAKKRRFETPYRTNKLSKIDIPEPIQEKKEIFTENYKKNKIYRLKDVTVYNTNTVDSYLTNFDYDTLLNFEFFGVRNDLTSTKMTVESIKELFLSLVNKKLIPLGWLENHTKLILWKLISYDVKFSLGVCTARNLINQLKYRYDRELYNAERPALRKILEKDDVASKTIVLCVLAIFDGGVKVDNVATTANIELLLTDGWYCVMTTTDKMLTRLVKERKIVVGSKIITNGAELMNCDQGVAPWEDTSSVRLKIFGNSSRRARWDARLGYHGNGAILSHLSNVKLDGGKVSKLRVYVARVYPALYVEKFDDGSTVTRSERLEHLHQIKYEAERQILMEKLYEEVEKEFSDQDSQGSETICDNRTSLQSGSQIFEALKRSKDPSDLRSHLTSSQTKLLEDHEGKRRERLVERAQARILDKMERNGLRRGRNVVTVLKVRVAGVDKNGVVSKGLLSIWKPNDSLMELIKEDTWIEVFNVVPTAVRYSEIQLSAGRQSVFLQSKFKETDRISVTTSLRRKCYTIKELNAPITTEYNEVDTAGIIFSIEPSIKEFNNKSQFQNVYLTDKECNIICVNFWGGLQKFGYQILDTGQIVAGINLQKRAGNTRNIPQYRVTEFSYFTKTPKNCQAKAIVDDLNKIPVLDRRRICEECIKLKNNCAVKGNVNITPYRMNNVDLSRNKAFLDSVERITHSEFNLTGLDFESTFKQHEELSPKTLKRKREVNNRINKLKMYGEPPPLTPIHIINKSASAMNSYKSPLTNDISPSVARIKNIMNISRNSDNTSLNSSKNSNSKIETSVASDKLEKVNIKDSPVTSLNKTYVKSSVNPVKLNFDNASNVDQFADEFEASPPLSLD